MSQRTKSTGQSPRAPGTGRKREKESRLTDRPSEKPRSLLWELLLGLAICFLILLSVEVVLRIAGIPGQRYEADPFVGFSALEPLFVVRDGTAFTSPRRLKFFNEVSFPVRKGPKTMRIFCFGGSTTYGRPFDGRTAFPRWLQELLTASCPAKNFEVINAGGISYASYRIVPLIREALEFKPDLMIVFTGHNEFLERRTYSGLFDQGRTLITVRSLVDRLHIYQALKRVLEPFLPVPPQGSGSGRKSTPSGENGKPGQKKTVLGGEVRAILDQSTGLKLYHRDEEFTRGVFRHFARNLRAMITLCRDAGVPVMLIDPVSNLKDFSPFKSEHSPGLDAAGKAAVDRKIQRAANLSQGGQYQDALLLLDETLREDPLYALAYYERGRALLGMGRYDEARASFVKAKDLDVCPLRAPSAILKQIEGIANGEKTMLVRFARDVERRQAERGDASRIPGNESFMDHVHPTVRCHQMLAESILEEMVSKGIVRKERQLSKEDRDKIYSTAMQSLDPDFFATKDLNLAKVLRWAGKKHEAKVALLRAAAVLKENPEVHKMLGSYFLDDGDYDRAVSEYRTAVQLSGNDPYMIFSLAVAYLRSGSRAKAVEAYKEIVEQGASIPGAYSNLGLTWLEEGKVDQALEVLDKGLKKDPDSPSLMGAYGLALAVSGKPEKGIPWMVRALEVEPGNREHLYNLAGMYALAGKTSDALECLNRAVTNGYRNAEKLARDPVFKGIRNDPRFRDLLDRLQKR